MKVRAAALYVYPVKSCAGMRVERLRFYDGGTIAGDREWAVVDAHGALAWQGSHPRLALLGVSLQSDGLAIAIPGQSAVRVAARDCTRQGEVLIWNEAAGRAEQHTGFDAGAQAAALLQRLTGDDLRLVRLGADALARSSINPVHLLSAASLQELNRELGEAGAQPAEVARFRPNIVIEGAGDALVPFIEEHFLELGWQSEGRPARLAVAGRCLRCVAVNVDPLTAAVGEQTAGMVARLSAQRYPGEGSYFGIYGVASGAALETGQAMTAGLDF